jgi:hypothetical protein
MCRYIMGPDALHTNQSLGERSIILLQMPKSLCYRCESIATSREHVPPRNLFPEARETECVDFRINLITVPSCDAHCNGPQKLDRKTAFS